MTAMVAATPSLHVRSRQRGINLFGPPHEPNICQKPTHIRTTTATLKSASGNRVQPLPFSRTKVNFRNNQVKTQSIATPTSTMTNCGAFTGGYSKPPENLSATAIPVRTSGSIASRRLVAITM
jgi:hypothetical protein